MKKLIKLLSVALITGSTAGSVVACSDVVIRKEQLKTVDTYKLRYAAITFYVDKVNSVNSIEEMISFYNGDEFNQRIVDYGVEGVVDVNAYLKEGTDNIIVIAPDVYSNYKEVEKEDNVEVKYDKGNTVVTLNVTNQIKEVVEGKIKSESTYAYLDDAYTSIEKAILSTSDIYFNKEKLDDILSKEVTSNDYPIKIDIENNSWTIDLNILGKALTDNFIFDRGTISGDINCFISDSGVGSFLNTPLKEVFLTKGWLTTIVISSGGYGDVLNSANKEQENSIEEITNMIYKMVDQTPENYKAVFEWANNFVSIAIDNNQTMENANELASKISILNVGEKKFEMAQLALTWRSSIEKPLGVFEKYKYVGMDIEYYGNNKDWFPVFTFNNGFENVKYSSFRHNKK
ncbi:Vmc-like lipoprotein signal peptide domain-containing protein [Spiroplasma endosymbiont of Diplazon laetatorius]|uniref:Vmc-like lipoprotein signal peptide domain-containing protein n=1 Tax=Spiroplasma endosymbiont of Diplazon laetatorius TaxID=3066322 RepID=UPI0030D3DCEF